VDPDEIKKCLAAYCRKPSTLEQRLRAIVRDEHALGAVMEAIAPALE